MGDVVHITEAQSFGSKPYKQKAHVFLEGMTNTSVALRAGERLFVLTDRGIEEGPHVGPDDVLIMTEHFRCWPVVAFAIPAQHLEAWRMIDPEKSAPKMMARVRGMLERRQCTAAKAPDTGDGEPPATNEPHHQTR